MASKRHNYKRSSRKGKRIIRRRRTTRRRRRNQLGGLLPLPLLALGAGIAGPIIAPRLNDLLNRLGI